MPEKKTFTFGTCAFDRTSPPVLTESTKVLNIILSFEEALKLGLSLDEGLRRLNSYNRSTGEGKRAALNLTVYLDAKRVAVNEDKLKKESSPRKA